MVTRAFTPSRLRIGYVALAVVDVAAAGLARGRVRRLRWLTKPSLMPVLAGYLDQAAGPGAPTLRRAGTAALGLSATGDVALLRGTERSFLAGLGAFLLAHLAYLSGFAATRAAATEPVRLARAWPAAAVLAVAVPTLWPRAGELRVPVAGYAMVIAAMLGAARTVQGTMSLPAARRISGGAALFVLSDGLIAIGRFLVPGRYPRPLDAAVMATYTLGQWLIVEGIVQATQP